MTRILFAMAIAALAFSAAPRAKGESPTPVATATPQESATPFRREDDLSMPLNTRTPAPSPNETKIGGKETRGSSRQSFPTSTPAPSATPVGAVGETKTDPRNIKPERPVYVPNPPDGSGLRTTNKLKEGRPETKSDKSKGKGHKRGEQSPSPTPNQ